MNASARLSALTLTLILSACAVGPDYKQPASVAPDRFARAPAPSAQTTRSDSSATALPTSGGDGTATASQPLSDDAFWRSFGDPQLSALIDHALDTNNDLKLAISRYDSSNAMLRNARFDLYPTVTASAQIGHQLTSKDQAFGAPRDQRDTPLSGTSINASWELDLFGRVRRSVEAQRSETAASAADIRAVRVAIAGDVAAAYIDLRGQQERLRIARDNAVNQRKTLDLIEARLAAGRGTDLDAARARAQFESTSSRIAVYEAGIAVDEHRLAVLTGQPPEALIAELDTPVPLPQTPEGIDPGTPGDVLRRRPDIAAAEERLHAATARVGVATADLFPRLSLSGMLGSLAFQYGPFAAGSATNQVLLGVDWSFLDVGRVRSRIAASRADAAGLLAQYQQTVLLALEDTENALIRYSRTRDEAAHLDRAASDSTQAAQLAFVRFQAGAIDYYEVLDAQRTALQAQDAAADSRTRSAGTAVALYKALAGGWPSPAPAPAPATPATPLALRDR